MRVLFLERHDTTGERAARAGQTKTYTPPSHWHAAAQRADEQDIWPVNVQITENTLHIEPHAASKDTLAEQPPSLALQPSPVVYRRVESTV